MSLSDPRALKHLEALGRRGYTISIVCGPCGSSPFRWSVDVLTPDGETFDQPYAAKSFAHAVFIVEDQIAKRGWYERFG